ncbi:MAG: tetratricopeptide repeat protein [Deltaproteobacteria bacterium]|nr:tetratricopeptide repeat protein [Deltaproteobacteria bacterium]
MTEVRRSCRIGWALRGHAPATALIALSAVVCYANTFHSSFHLDDLPAIVDNPKIRSLGSFLGRGAGYGFLSAPRYLGWLSFALDFSLHGLDVVGYHAVNLAIHLGNAVLLYGIVRLAWRTPRMGGPRTCGADEDRIGPLLAALLFAVHPVQTQAVTYVVQRFASLATLFYLGTVLAYASWRLAREKGCPRPFFYALSLALAACALRTKEIAYTLPLALALFEAVFFRGEARRRARGLAPYFALAVALFGATLALGGPLLEVVGPPAGPGVLRPTRSEYLLTEARVVVTYIRLLLWPAGQNVDYDVPLSRSLDGTVLASSLLLVGLLALALALLRRAGDNRWPRLAGFGILWFFLTLTVESGAIPLADVLFEHRLYLPSVGAFAAVSASAVAAFSALRGWPLLVRRAAVAALVVLLVAFGVSTRARNRVWRDEVILWEDVTRKSPGKARGYVNLGAAYQNLGQFGRALAAFDRAVALEPRDADAYGDRAVTYLSLGRYDLALRDLTVALALAPSFAQAYSNRGLVRYRTGDVLGAILDYNRALRLLPGEAAIHYNRGLAYARVGRLDLAVGDYRSACNLGHEAACRALATLGR